MTRDFGFPVPARIAKLPTDHRGFPVPWFVAWVDGKPDFRVIRKGGIALAVANHVCWLCGEQLGAYLAFVIGPMCAVNRVSSEPPSHRECAEFAAKACPFLANPQARRKEKDMPDGVLPAAGVGLKRNPGVTLVWITKGYRTMRAPGGILFRIGAPTETLWFAEGRKATRAEVNASIESGLPLLREPAEEQERAEPGCGALAALERMVRDAQIFLPAP